MGRRPQADTVGCDHDKRNERLRVIQDPKKKSSACDPIHQSSQVKGPMQQPVIN